jgi:hypothetical protein
VRGLLLIVLTLAASVWAGAAHAAGDISRIPRIGFGTVTRVADGGLCGHVADAMVAREKIKIGEADASDAILIVRPLKLALFPKRISSVGDLFKRLSSEAPPCTGDSPSTGPPAAALVYEKKPDGSVLRVLKYVLQGCADLASGLFCGGLIQAPGYLNVEFTHGSIRSGLEELKRGFGFSPQSYKRPVLSLEQERIFEQDPDSPALPRDLSVQYTFAVEPRQEEPWAFILNRLPYVEDAERAPERVAAVDAARIFAEDEKINRLPRSPLVNGAIHIPDAQERSLTFLKEWFAKRGGLLTVLKRDDNRLLVRVDHLRGEVIRQEKFWEYLNVNLILIMDQNQTKLYLMEDGYYAAGIGARVPPDASFASMEHDYYSNLAQYTEALATEIEQNLKGQP